MNQTTVPWVQHRSKKKGVKRSLDDKPVRHYSALTDV